TNVNGTLFFTGFDPTGKFEVFRSDGTDAGTFVVKDITLPSQYTFPFSLRNLNGTLVFVRGVYSSDFSSLHFELWKSDGTEAGTQFVEQIATDPAQPYPNFPTSFTASGGNLYFVTDDGLHGQEPWIFPVARVENVVIDDGTAQRSMVRSITVTFSDIVTL